MPDRSDIDLLDLIAFETETIRQEHKDYYYDHPQEYLELADKALSEATAGPLLGIAVSAIFTGISGGTWLAIAGVLVSGLVQWWLSPKPEVPRQPDAVFQPKYGTESLGGFARSGQTIPGIWCSRSLDPSGGVVVGGDLVHSRIETINGNQITYARFVVSIGEIGNIDLTRTTVNEQPIQQFSQQDITQSWQPGKPEGALLADYPFWSQNLPVSVNSTCGAGLVSKSINSGSSFIGVTNIGNFTKTFSSLLGLQVTRWYRLNVVPEKFFTVDKIDTAGSRITINQDLTSVLAIGQTIQFSTPAGGIAGTINSLPIASSTSFTVPASEFESYGNSVKYMAVTDNSANQGSTNTFFRIIEKTKSVANNQAFYSLTSDTTIPKGNATIYTYNSIQYQTTRRLNRIDFNFQCQVWGRNSKGELVDFAQVYSLSMNASSGNDLLKVCYFFIRSSNPGTLFRSLTVESLSLDSYSFEIKPEIITTQTVLGLPCFELKEDGSYSTANIAFGQIRCQGKLNETPVSILAPIADQNRDRVADSSAQKGTTLNLQNVNEIQSIGSDGLAVDCSYKGLATTEIKIRASELVGRQQNFAFFVTEGIICNSLIQHLVIGDSSDNAIVSQSPIQAVIEPGNPLYLRNVTKRQQSLVTSVGTNQLYLQQFIDSEIGDEAILFTRRSTCYWPEIYADLASESKYGLSSRLLSDYYLNYQQLVNNLRWVKGDNQHDVAFAWHGAITAKSELAVINNNNCKKTLLLPSRSDGRAAFFEQKTPLVVALYNEHNSSSHKIETVGSRLNINTLTVTYREQDSSGADNRRLKYRPRDITVQSLDAYNGVVPENRSTIDLQECTNYKQAAKSAQVMFNAVRYSGARSISMNAATVESLGLEVGSLIDVRTTDRLAAGHYTGTCLVANELGQFRLDKELKLATGTATGSNPSGLRDIDIDFIAAGVQSGDIVRNLNDGATSVVTAVSLSSLECSPVVSDLSDYEILDMTLESLSMRTISYVDNSYKLQGIYPELVGGQQWFRANLEQPLVGATVSIAPTTEDSDLYQCLAVAPVFSTIDGSDNFEVQVVGSNWDKRFFDYSDTVMISYRGIKFGGAI